MTNTAQARLSLYSSMKATSAARFLTMAELVAMAQAPSTGPKKKAALITPFESEGKTGEHAQAAQFAALVVDYDTGNYSEERLRQLYGPKGYAVAYLAFTTSSHQQAKDNEPPANRWKVVIPYAYPVDADTATTLATALALLERSDPAQARKQQGFYAPNKLAADAPYTVINELGAAPWLAPDDANFPLVAKAMDALAAFEATAAANVKPRPATPQPVTNSQGRSIIELINQSYGMAELLEAHGYRKTGPRYLSPFSESAISGVVLLKGDNGQQVVYSHHGPSDPLSALNHGGHSLDVADVLCCLAYGGDFSAMIKQEAAKRDSEGNKQRQRDYMRQQELGPQQQRQLEQLEQLRRHHGIDSPQWQDTDAEAEAAASNYQHPLTRIVDLDTKPQPPAWVIPDFIAEGLVIIAGGHGVGKTTALLPLALVVAGISTPNNQLAPKHWRHVVYITEDIQQAKRIIAGLTGWLETEHGEADLAQPIRDRFHLVEAARLTPDNVASAGGYYRREFSRTVASKAGQVELLPLVVMDTIAATIELENENDNSEVSKAVAKFKQQFEGLPLWLVGHTAKANLGAEKNITTRGATAWEADANQVLYLIKDKSSERRYIQRGKTRFESLYTELELKSHSSELLTVDRFGEPEYLTLRWSVAQALTQSRAAVAEQAKAERAKEAEQQLRLLAVTALSQAMERGERLNRTGLAKAMGGKRATATALINDLILEGVVYEVEIPNGQRQQPRRGSFLVPLTPSEQAHYKATGEVPAEKRAIPIDWGKPPAEDLAAAGAAEQEAS